MRLTEKHTRRRKYPGKRQGGTRKLRVVNKLGTKEWFIGTAGLMTSKAVWTSLDELNLLEVNSTFYRLPTVKQTDSWLQMPERVSFVFKMSKYVTHIKRLKDVEDSVGLFMNSIKPMLPRMKGVLVQLPPSFKYTDVTFQRIVKLHHLLKDYKFDVFVEFRDPSWFVNPVYDLFRRIKWVVVGTWINKKDGGGFMGDMPGGLVLPGPKTTDACYVRLHGARGFRGSYSDKDLTALRDAVTRRGCAQNFIVFNNTFFHNRSQSCTIHDKPIRYAAVCNAVRMHGLISEM
jgi:uncharacterized protein YecE (DUF72 family)